MCARLAQLHGKISDSQPEGPGFNPRLGRGLDFGRPSFATPSVDRDVKPLIWIVSQRSIGGLKRAHTLVDKRRLMPVLWTVTSSYKGAPLVESNLCGKPLPYAEKSCK